MNPPAHRVPCWSGRPTKILAAAAGTVLLAAAVAGCSDQSKADPIPQVSMSPTTTSQAPTATPRKTGGPPAGWEKKFTRQQLHSFNAAVGRYRRYNELTDDIYRKGKDTPQARAVLKEYDLLWQRDIVVLGETYDKGGVRQDVPPKRLWYYPKSVKPNVDVVMVQCTDYSPVRYTQRGRLLKSKPKNLVTPLLVTMTKPSNHGWMVVSEKLRDKTSCAA